MTDRILLTLLGPLLLTQGRRLRRDLPVLPEPPGPREGTMGAGPPLGLLVVGDSSAAGVGAATQDEALLGQLLEHLSGRRTVRYRLVARTGWTTRHTLAALEKQPAESFDVAVTSLGANDATRLTEPADFVKQQQQLMAMFHERFGIGRVIVSGLPPMHLFPAMPQPLRWAIGRRARQLDQALARSLHDHPFARHLRSDFTLDAKKMAPDGFHPGPQIYRLWGSIVADLILS